MTEREALLRLASIISEMATDLGLCHYSDEAETVERAFLYDEQPADKPEGIAEEPCDDGNIAGGKGEEEIAPCPLCGGEWEAREAKNGDDPSTWWACCAYCCLEAQGFGSEADLLAYLNGSWREGASQSEHPSPAHPWSNAAQRRRNDTTHLEPVPPAPDDALKVAYQKTTRPLIKAAQREIVASLLKELRKRRAMVSDPAPMEPLGRDFEQVWEDNLDALYESDPAPQPKQEPVAWAIRGSDGLIASETYDSKVQATRARQRYFQEGTVVPLYTHPAPLGTGEPTDAQCVDIWRTWQMDTVRIDGEADAGRSLFKAVRKVLGGEA
jgi:hypothetical protein